jgi:hypothetical protein
MQADQDMGSTQKITKDNTAIDLSIYVFRALRRHLTQHEGCACCQKVLEDVDLI